MNTQEIVVLALRVSIKLTVFGFGLEGSIGDLLYLLRRPRLLVLSLTAMFVIMPLFAIFLTRVVHFNPAVVIALIALSISPVPPLLPRKMTKAGGIAPYGLGLMVMAATLAILYIPLASDLIGRYFDRDFGMSPGNGGESRCGFDFDSACGGHPAAKGFAPAVAARITLSDCCSLRGL